MATVVSCERTYSQTQSGPGGVGAPKTLCKLELRVEPAGEATFDARTDASLLGTEGAHEGMVVVLHDPSDHSKLVVDQSEGSAGLQMAGRCPTG